MHSRVIENQEQSQRTEDMPGRKVWKVWRTGVGRRNRSSKEEHATL